jgi:hypothetical protein
VHDKTYSPIDQSYLEKQIAASYNPRKANGKKCADMSRLTKEIILILLFKLAFLAAAKWMWFSNPPSPDPVPAYLHMERHHD